MIEHVTDDAEPSQAVPQPSPARPRIGDAERDRAVDYLQEHMAQGRLDRDEFDERLSRALVARTQFDLEPLFQDLPEPRPSTALQTRAPFVAPPWTAASAVPAASSSPAELSTPEVPPPTPRWLNVTMAAIWPATILVYVLTDFGNWWLFVVAAMLTYFLRQAFTPDHHRKKQPPEIGR